MSNINATVWVDGATVHMGCDSNREARDLYTLICAIKSFVDLDLVLDCIQTKSALAGQRDPDVSPKVSIGTATGKLATANRLRKAADGQIVHIPVSDAFKNPGCEM